MFWCIVGTTAISRQILEIHAVSTPHINSHIEGDMEVDFPLALKVLLYATAACLSHRYVILLFAIPFSVHNSGLFSENTHHQHFKSLRSHLVGRGRVLRPELRTDLHIHHRRSSSARPSGNITVEMINVKRCTSRKLPRFPFNTP